MGLAVRDQGARRRRCGGIVDDEQRGYRAAIPTSPEGYGRRRAVCFVVAPQRCHRIACVATPRIRPVGARNAMRSFFQQPARPARPVALVAQGSAMSVACMCVPPRETPSSLLEKTSAETEKAFVTTARNARTGTGVSRHN